jgi:hypothetical protein
MKIQPYFTHAYATFFARLKSLALFNKRRYSFISCSLMYTNRFSRHISPKFFDSMDFFIEKNVIHKLQYHLSNDNRWHTICSLFSFQTIYFNNAGCWIRCNTDLHTNFDNYVRQIFGTSNDWSAFISFNSNRKLAVWVIGSFPQVRCIVIRVQLKGKSFKKFIMETCMYNFYECTINMI